MSLEISADSSKEEVANYFFKEFKISEESKNNFIKEDISGDVLLDVTDFKIFGVKTGPLMKIKKFIKNNEEKLKHKKEFEEKITTKSSVEEVKNFFEKSLDFKGDITLSGEKLLELDEEKIKALSLNIGQKIKLLRYIDYFKTLKDDEDEKKEDEYIVTPESTQEEINNYLRFKVKLSAEIVDSLSLDAESLFLLNDDEIDDLTELKDEEKERLKISLKEMKNISNIEINNNSSKEDVANFLKIKLKLSNKIIQELDLDGQSLFKLESQNIDEISQIEEEEKEKLKNLLIQIKQKHEAESKPNIVITIESNSEDVAKFLKIKLNFSDESIKELELDGESLFGLDTDAINEANIKEEEKKKFNRFFG